MYKSRKLLYFFLCLALVMSSFIFVTTTAYADGPYYVATNGNDNNPGTFSQPFLTLEKARNTMRTSATKITYIRAGTYNRTAILSLDQNDSGETWSYYPPDGYNTAVLDGGNNVDTIFSINGQPSNGASHITFNGIKIQHFYTWGINGTNVPYLTIENCDVGYNVITDWVSGAIHAGGWSDHVWFKNNCPMNGPLYDSFSICDRKSGDVLYWATGKCGHSGQAEIFSREKGFDEPLAKADNFTQLLKLI